MGERPSLRPESPGLRPEIVQRKSITAWRKERIEKSVWTSLLDAARSAPSSWNQQPARYVVVDDDKQRARLCRALHRTNRWADHAPAIVIQVARPQDDDVVGNQPYYLFDCGLAMMSLVYQAQSLGISTRMMIGFDEADVRRVIQLPDAYRIVVMAGLGYLSDGKITCTAATLKRRLTGQHKRYRLEDIASWQVWAGEAE